MPARKGEANDPTPPPPLASRKTRAGVSAEGEGEAGEEVGEDDEGEEDEDDTRNKYDSEGRRLCNTFGCTLLNNHFGLHKLPSVENNEGRQKRQSSQINFRKLASKGLERAEIGQGRQLGKPDAVLERMREKKKAMRRPEPEPLLRPHVGITALLAGEDLAELEDEDDADADADADEEVSAAGQKSKRHKSEADGGESGGGGTSRSRPNHKFGIGSRVRYLRPGSAQGCGGTIVDAKCGYWVVSVDGGPRAPVYARASMLESLDGGEVTPAGSCSAVSSAVFSSQGQGAVSSAMAGLSARAASKQREDGGAEDMGGEGSLSCGYCGRKLANAGSHANHERACASALQLKVYPEDSAQRRNPGASGQCRRNPLCVRGLRHRGLGGPCRLSGEPGLPLKRPSAKQKFKGRKSGSHSGPSGRIGRRKPKYDVDVDDEEEEEEEEEEAEAHYEGGGGGGSTSRAGGGEGQRARPIKKTTIPGRVGHAIVGRTIEVFWQADGWQEGRVLSYNPATGKHTVEYTHQGAIEQLTLAKEQWRQDEPETEYDSSEEDEEDEEDEGGEEDEDGEEGDDGEEGAMASEEGVPDGGVEALLAMSALVNAAIKVRRPAKARESGRSLPRASVKEGRAGASGKLPKGVAPASKRAPTVQRTASAGAEQGRGAALARIGSISDDRGGGRADAELSFEPMHLELTNVKPQWLMVQLTQNTIQGARRRVKSLPDAWLGVHLANRPTACIGDAERCCPIPKLSPGGQLCIRQADLAGLADGLYQFALYSRHLCVASTLAIRFRQNRFTDEIYEHPVDEEPSKMAPYGGKRRKGAGGAKRQRVTSPSARRAKGAKLLRAAGSLAADGEEDASDLGGGESEEGEGEEEEDERPNPLLAAVTALASGRGLGAEEMDEAEDEGHAAASSGGAPEDEEAEEDVDEEVDEHEDDEMEAEAADGEGLGEELAAAEKGSVLAAPSDEDGVMGEDGNEDRDHKDRY